MKKKIRIAVYSGEIPSTVFIERLIFGLSKQDYEVYLFGFLKSDKEYSKGIKIKGYTANRLLKFYLLLKYSLLLFLFKRKGKQKLDQIINLKLHKKTLDKIKYYPVLWYQPDIFHLQWAKSVAEWSWVQEFGIKLVLSLRGTHITISPIADEKLSVEYHQYFCKLDGFHAVSNSIGDIAKRYDAAHQKVKTVYSGLDIEKFPFVLKEKINTPLKIVSVGRAHWVKGYNYALDALSILEKQLFDFDYSIIGIEANEELIVQRSHLGLDKQVHFVSQKPFQEVLSAIREADVLLLPSVEEGIANVVLEAMALGTLVISTDCGGMNEVIQDDENGFLVPIRNPEAMAVVLQKVSALFLADYQRMTLAARKTVENQHSHQKMIADMKVLYETVLDESLCE